MNSRSGAWLSGGPNEFYGCSTVVLRLFSSHHLSGDDRRDSHVKELVEGWGANQGTQAHRQKNIGVITKATSGSSGTASGHAVIVVWMVVQEVWCGGGVCKRV